MSEPIPVAIFAYSRPAHLRRTLVSLQANPLAPRTNVIVFSDGPRSATDAPGVDAVREELRNIQGFASFEVICRPANLGLAASIIDGVTTVCGQYGGVIVIEDDLVVSPYFLNYMNDALRIYADTPEVVSICGYTPPVRTRLPETYFLRGADCWGWATWQRGWSLFEANGAKLLRELEARGLSRAFDLNDTYGYTDMLRAQIAGLNQSWAIRWHASAFLRGKLSLYPGQSLVQNSGNDGSGTQCVPTQLFDVEVTKTAVRVTRLPLKENAKARRALESFYRKLEPVPKISRSRRLVRRAVDLLQDILATRGEPRP